VFWGPSELSVSVISGECKVSTCRDLYQLFGLLKSMNRGRDLCDCMLYDVGGGRIEDGGAVAKYSLRTLSRIEPDK
jgi:hypothetical protein